MFVQETFPRNQADFGAFFPVFVRGVIESAAGAHINLSLSTLGRVVGALARRAAQSYRCLGFGGSSCMSSRSLSGIFLAGFMGREGRSEPGDSLKEWKPPVPFLIPC